MIPSIPFPSFFVHSFHFDTPDPESLFPIHVHRLSISIFSAYQPTNFQIYQSTNFQNPHSFLQKPGHFLLKIIWDAVMGGFELDSNRAAAAVNLHNLLNLNSIFTEKIIGGLVCTNLA